MTTEEEEIQKQTAIEKDKPEEDKPDVSLGSLAEKLKAEKKAKKKKMTKRIILFSFLALFSYGVYFLFKPYQESIDFGICKTLLELHVTYPHTIYISEVQRLRSGTMRIWFMRIDPFGEYRMDPFECTFKKDPETGVNTLTAMKIGRVDIDPELVKNYNYAIPYILQNPPSLILPAPLPDSINSLQMDVNKFRKVVVK